MKKLKTMTLAPFEDQKMKLRPVMRVIREVNEELELSCGLETSVIVTNGIGKVPMSKMRLVKETELKLTFED